MASSRFVLHDQPPALPGVCFICKSVNDGPFVDTGHNVPFEGAVYIGANCLREMYQLLEPNNGLNQGQLDYLKKRVTDEVDSQFGLVFSYVGDVIHDARTRIGNSLSVLIPNLPVVDVPSFEMPEVADEDNVGDTDANVEGDSAVGSEGPDDVPGNSDDGNVDAGDEDNEFRF